MLLQRPSVECPSLSHLNSHFAAVNSLPHARQTIRQTAAKPHMNAAHCSQECLRHVTPMATSRHPTASSRIRPAASAFVNCSPGLPSCSAVNCPPCHCVTAYAAYRHAARRHGDGCRHYVPCAPRPVIPSPGARNVADMPPAAVVQRLYARDVVIYRRLPCFASINPLLSAIRHLRTYATKCATRKRLPASTEPRDARVLPREQRKRRARRGAKRIIEKVPLPHAMPVLCVRSVFRRAMVVRNRYAARR